jgi:hypothetical protein
MQEVSMMLNSLQVRVIAKLGVVGAALALVVGCAQQPKPVTVSDSVEATATVEAIDQATRMVRLRGTDGRLWVVQAGPSVRNIGQVKPGDLVKVRYTEAIAAEVVKPGTGVTSTGATTALQRADAGKLPGATETVSMKGVVKVVAVDTTNNTVDIIVSDGTTRRIKVADPKAQEFIRGLRVGDEVQLTFSEALAISVEPAR